MPQSACGGKVRQPANSLAPAENLLDPLALAHADFIFLARRHVGGNGRAAHLSKHAHHALNGDVRHDLEGLQTLDERRCVIALVCAQGRGLLQILRQLARGLALCCAIRLRGVAIDHKPVAVLRERMAEISQLASLTTPLAIKLRIGVNGGGVHLVGTLLIPEVALAIAAWRRRLARTILRAHALHRSPGFQHRAIDPKVVCAEQFFHLWLRQQCAKKLPRDVGRQQVHHK